jgi:hypothetical protein
MELNRDSPEWRYLEPRLKALWPGDDFDRNVAAAMKILEQGGPEHLKRLEQLPLSSVLTLACAYSKVGTGESDLPEDEVRLAGELLCDRRSSYWDGNSDLHKDARGLVTEVMQLGSPEPSADEGSGHADTSQPSPREGAGPSPQTPQEAMQQALAIQVKEGEAHEGQPAVDR